MRGVMRGVMPAPLRLHVPGLRFAVGESFDLPEAAARHLKVRRGQPGDALRLFDGLSTEEAGEGPALDWPAEVVAITRAAVQVRITGEAVSPPAAELPIAVTLAFGMPANDRIDALIEKATELGAAAFVPLITERSVLRLEGDRAERRREHWQAVAVAACEQCGRARVPRVLAVQPLDALLAESIGGVDDPALTTSRWLLSTAPDAPALAARFAVPSAPTALTAPTERAEWTAQRPRALFLSGPEGGLSAAEEARAREAGFAPVSLGSRVLRADTAPLAVLGWIALSAPAGFN
jgi:16S rRNA (uracil1498-N3)-methyltransferase